MMGIVRRSTDSPVTEPLYPPWFSAFLADRAVRKPSPHTAKAYRQDFAAIAELLPSERAQIAHLTPADITRDAIRAAFAAYAVHLEHLVHLPSDQRPHQDQSDVNGRPPENA